MPALELLNRQRRRRLDLVLFRRFAELALTKVMERNPQVCLPEEIIVVFVSDAGITRIHRDFMSLNGPTDVITFQHGEIFISVEAAERQREKFSGDLHRELRIYFVHGLLHLLGLEDLTQQGFEKMAMAQETIVQSVDEKLACIDAQPRSRGSATLPGGAQPCRVSQGQHPCKHWRVRRV
jgi:probable rRNA maturation factor